MKNVHLITKEQEGADVLHQYLYITSNEKIKEGDWVILTNKEIIKAEEADENPKRPCKIILTTDPDLIKDGVQAIDDEFLEWFVKNPTCEHIPIITTIVNNESDYKTNIGFESWRKEELSKRVKINFESINKERYEIIPPEKVAESREQIKQNMKTFLKKINNLNNGC